MGAIVEKPSVCPLDCPDTCSLTVKTDGERVLSVRGSNGNPYTAGKVCDKITKSYPDFVHGTERLTKPMLRTGPRGTGAFTEISWDEALDRVHAGLSKAIAAHGPQSVIPFNYAGPHGEIAGGSMDRRFFYKLGASLINRGPLCGSVRGSAYTSLYGAAPGMAPEQAAHADLIVVWGNNVTVSNLHLARVIKAARDKGAKLIVIDPKRTKIAEQADLHLHIAPGTDVILGLAAAAALEARGAVDDAFVSQWVDSFDTYMQAARQYSLADAESQCGLNAADIGTFLTWYAKAERVAVSVGNGIERGRSGGSGLRAAMALQAITGNHGRIGAGVIAKPGLAIPKSTDRLQRPDLIPEGTRTLNIVDLGKLMLDRTLDTPIAAAVIYNHNPVATHPDQNRMRRALSQEDVFLAGIDVAMTDSMLYCDVILPAASHFEFADIYGSYGHSYLQRAAPVIPCVGDSLPNTEIFRRLAAKFGFDDPMFADSDEDLIDQALNEQDPRLSGTRPRDLPLGKAFDMSITNATPMVMCDTVVPATPSGKIELFCQDLEDKWGYGLPRFEPVARTYPLTIISPSSSKRTNATFGGCPESDGLEIVEINPVDAEARSIAEGDTLLVHNEKGKTTLSARITDAVRPGVLYTPKGTWLKHSETGETVNALMTADLRTDIEDGACYNETFVDVETVR